MIDVIDRHAEHQSMIRRVEQAQKAVSSFTHGRSQQAGLAKALGAVLDEAYERMTMAWSVLNSPLYAGALGYTYRSQKAAELSLCYITIVKAYDELCQCKVIGKDDKTEPTTYDLVAAHKENEREAHSRRRRAAPREPR